MYNTIKINSKNSNGFPAGVKECSYEMEEELLSDPETRKNLSYWKNPGTEPLKNITVGELLNQTAEKYNDRQALCVYQGSRLTFSQAHNQAETFAAGLLALGLQKGDHVGIWAPNTLEWYISFLGIIKAGLVAKQRA